MILLSYDGIPFLSYDGTGYDCWIGDGSGHALPSVQAQLAPRIGAWPVLSGLARPGRRFTMFVYILGDDLPALRTAMFQLFDPEDETPKQLVASADDGSRERYLMCLCEALQPAKDGGGFSERLFVATMVVDGDVRWRSVSVETVTWLVTVDGDTETVNNPGDDEAYPVLTIEATAGGAPYRRFVPIVWRAVAGATQYPIQIGGLDTATMVTAGKMQSDGSDLRVESDGLEIDRWLYNMDSADTDIWVNLDFDAAVAMTLNGAIDDDDTTIVVNEAIAALPSSGLLLIESEVVAYDSKNDGTKTFSGCTRGARNTTAAAHVDATAGHWLQHDVYIYYGGDAAQAADDDYAPMFELASSDNGTWDYDEFGEDDGLRVASWNWWTAGASEQYTADHGGTANPWEELGIRNGGGLNGNGYLRLYNPCYISTANFQNCEKFATLRTELSARLSSSADGTSWSNEYAVPDPTLDATWESWNRNETITSEKSWVALNTNTVSGSQLFRVEAADVTITLNSSYTPVVTVGGEIGLTARVLAARIGNNETGEAIDVNYTLSVNDELEIDTDAKTVTDLSDSSNQRQALSVVDGPRRHWLKLEPGDNELEWAETTVLETIVTVEFEARYYD